MALFDLETDPGETTDLSAQYPEVVKRPGVGSFQVGLLRDQGGDLSVGITGSVSQQSGDNGYGDEFDTFPGFIRCPGDGACAVFHSS